MSCKSNSLVHFIPIHEKNTFDKQVFPTPPENLNNLRQRIINECNTLRDNRTFIRNAVRHMEKRARLCIERDGRSAEGHDDN